MNHALAVRDFIRTYGVPLVWKSDTGEEEIYALISPVNQLGALKEAVEYTKAGFLPRQEYLLLLPASEHPVKSGETLTGKEKAFRIKQADNYLLGEEAMYQRVYAYEVRSVDND